MPPGSKMTFHTLFSWNLWGSVSFETLKVLHNFLMLSLLPGAHYGIIGTMFAGVYLAARFADLGTAYSITPFFHLFIHSKKTFRDIFLKKYLFPVFPIIGVFGLISAFIASKHFIHVPFAPALWIVPCLVIGESLRSILRQFLHISFKSKPIILIELMLFVVYLGVVWIPFALGFVTLNTNWIFVPYCIDSLLALVLFTYIIKKMYALLPEESSPVPVTRAGLSARMWRTRLFNYLTTINRELFTSNMITPLFALKFGLKQAGIFYFASMLARSLYGIIRSTITHPGNALLAQVKNGDAYQKKEAFELVSAKVVLTLAPLLICLGFNYKKLVMVSLSTECSNTTLVFTAMYLLITFSELFFLLYEQFYILEESAGKLFIFKCAEVALFYGLIAFDKSLSPLSMLFSIVILRSITFMVVALNGFYQWGIVPHVKIPLSYLAGYLGLAILTSLILSVY
jgi:hypothetical protein